MMVTTHALLGVLFVAPLAVLFPEYATLVAASGLFGGVFPDFDTLVGTHRKTLHFPVLYWPLTAVLFAATLTTPIPILLAVTAASLAAAVHSTSDIFGGGLEREPWAQTTHRGVYDHTRDQWLAPRHYVAYDGSIGDCLLTILLVPTLFLYGNLPHRPLVAGGVITIAISYTAVRKRLPDAKDSVCERYPQLRRIVPGLHN